MSTAMQREVDLSLAFADERPSGSVLRDALFHPGTRDRSADSLRVAPFLALVDDGRSGTIIAVGHSVVVTTADAGPVRIETRIAAAWVEHEARTGRFVELVEADRPVPPDHRLSRPVQRAIQAAVAGIDLTSTGEDSVARVAKALSESSRESVALLRDQRYELERTLAETSGGSAGSRHTTVVSSLLQLDIMCGRSRDIVREIEREGLWLHLTDADAYHSYRQLQDPRLLTGLPEAANGTRSWMRQHDAALRQCAAMKTQLEEEMVSLRSLIASAASISNSKDADAQSRFNVIAAIASIGLGLPALVLSLYGATVLLPMDGARFVLFLPVMAALLIAAAIAVWQGIVMRHGRIWIFAAVGILLFVGILLYVAGRAASLITP